MMKTAKGLNPLISTAIIIFATVSAIGIVLAIANPAIQRARDATAIAEATANMKVLDDNIKQVASEATGSLRTVSVNVADGDYTVRNGTGIEYTFTSETNTIPSRVVIRDGALKISTGISALGLVGYWKFDEGGGGTSKDSSGYDNHGTIGINANWTEGKVGNAVTYSLTSSSNTTIAHSSALGIRDALTVIAWSRGIRTSGVSEVVAKDQVSPGSFALLYNNTDNATIFITRGLSNVNLRGTIVVNDNIWHHVVGVYNTTHKLIYVDGVLDVVVAATGQITSATINVTIGVRGDDSNRYNGTIGEVKIYNRALTQAEIQDDHNFNLPPNKAKISLDYDGIIVTGQARLGKGTANLCIEKIGVQRTKAVVNIRNC